MLARAEHVLAAVACIHFGSAHVTTELEGGAGDGHYRLRDARFVRLAAWNRDALAVVLATATGEGQSSDAHVVLAALLERVGVAPVSSPIGARWMDERGLGEWGESTLIDLGDRVRVGRRPRIYRSSHGNEALTLEQEAVASDMYSMPAGSTRTVTAAEAKVLLGAPYSGFTAVPDAQNVGDAVRRLRQAGTEWPTWEADLRAPRSARRKASDMQEAFFEAAILGDFEACHAALGRGAQIDAPATKRVERRAVLAMTEGMTCAARAIRGRDVTLLRWLCDRGTNVDDSPHGMSLLARAAHAGDDASLALLLERGADPRRDERVMASAHAGNSIAVIRRLLDAGVSPGKMREVLAEDARMHGDESLAMRIEAS